MPIRDQLAGNEYLQATVSPFGSAVLVGVVVSPNPASGEGLVGWEDVVLGRAAPCLGSWAGCRAVSGNGGFDDRTAHVGTVH